MRSYATLTDMLSTERPYESVVATPDALHVERGLDCTRHGALVLVEKPLLDSMKEAASLTEASEEAKVPLLAAPPRRHSPNLTKVRYAESWGMAGPGR